MISTSERIFDTRFDTNKLYVSMRTKFVLRKDSNKDSSPVYLHITGGSTRERLKLDITVDKSFWIEKKQRVEELGISKKTGKKEILQQHQDVNLMLDNIEAKITNIKTVYRLSEKVLTPLSLKRELINNLPRVNFCSYFSAKLEDEKVFLKHGTYKKLEAVLNKIKDWREEIIFTEINDAWFKSYRKHLKSLGNKETTINSNVKSVKKFLRLAQKDGIKIPIDLDDVKAGRTTGTKVALKPTEIKKIHKYLFSEFINPQHKTILSYFLFSCLTGLRFGDVMKIKREDFDDGFIQFIAQKTEKDQVITLNNTAKNIVNECKDLFVTKYTNEYMNRELKKIMIFLNIRKKVSFHVSRHTFATSFLRAGGKVEKLQILMGHSDIKTTMEYVHLIAAEANKEIHLLDQLF